MDLKFTPDSYGGIVLAEAYWIKRLDSGSGFELGLDSAWKSQFMDACPAAKLTPKPMPSLK